MDLIDQLNGIASTIEKASGHLTTEEATKHSLIMPMIQALGYNVFNPTEVIPEFTADIGTKKGEKVDYVIIINEKPAILIECKTAGSKLSLNHANQLFRYFSTTEARFAILTNGIEYQFYTDIENQNKMDDKPFFEFSMNRLDPSVVNEIKKFSKSNYDLENILSNASELKYKKQIKILLQKELEAPSEEFVKHFTQQVYSGKFIASIKEQFTPIVDSAFKEFIKDHVNKRLQTALEGNQISSEQVEPKTLDAVEEEESNQKNDIETTEEEIMGYHIIRAICSKFTDPKRVIMRDTKSYCGILLDDNNRKPIARLRFNYSKKYIGVFENGAEVKFPIDDIESDIYKFAENFEKTIKSYESYIKSRPQDPPQQETDNNKINSEAV